MKVGTHRRQFNRRYDLLVDIVTDSIPGKQELRVYVRVENPRLVRRHGRLRRAV